LLALSPLSKNKQLASDTEGDLSGKINISGIPNAMSGSANLTLGPGRLAGEPVEGMVARATFNGPNVNIESVDLRLVAGHIVANGNFNTTTKAFDFQGRAENIELARLTALANRPNISVSGIANFTAHVAGSLSEDDFSAYQITFDGEGRDVVINGRPAGTVALTGRTENKQLSINLTTGLLGQPQVVAAQINLASPVLPATIETTLTNADLTNLFQILLPNTGVRVAGRANGKIRASGNLVDDDDNFSLAGLSGTAEFSELSFKVEDIQLAATTPLIVRFTPNEVAFDAARFTGPGTNIVLDGIIASGAGGRQSLNVNGDLNLRVLNGVSPDFFSSGTAEVAVRLNGSFEDPRLIGTASINSGSVSVLLGNDRWTVANLRAAIRFTANQAQIDAFEGTLGGGRISATGGALLEASEFRRFASIYTARM
jgi:autotransporter translocation and assembly factor TamB